MDKFKTIKFTDGDLSLDVRVSVEDGTIWLTKQELAILFSRDRSFISRVIKTTYIDSRLSEVGTCAKNAHVVCKNGRNYYSDLYNIDIVKEIDKRLSTNKAALLLNAIGDCDPETNKSNHFIYNNGCTFIDVTISPKEETVWLSQDQISNLFDTTQQNVSLHIKNIFEEGELDMSSVYKEFLYTAKDNKQYLVAHYNLDLILAIGYRIKGKIAIDFRKWATKILKNYLFNGVAFNDGGDNSIFYKGLTNLSNQYAELKEEIRLLKTNNTLIEKENIFFNGEYFDAYEFVSDLLSKAKRNIKIIDPYFDRKGLSFLKKISSNIEKKIYKSSKSKLMNIDLQKFESQYGKITMKTIDNFHDRFIIIDDQLCYALGTSLNHMGKRVFAVNQIETKELVDAILARLN